MSVRVRPRPPSVQPLILRAFPTTTSRSKTSGIAAADQQADLKEPIVKMLPSVRPFAGMQQAASGVGEKQFSHTQAIINSITMKSA